MGTMTLNEMAMAEAEILTSKAEAWRVDVRNVAGVRVIDCGGAVTGSLRAGLQMARVCLAGLAEVEIVPGAEGPCVQVYTDDPVRACLASQYAGWQIKLDRYLAMGSGPMRAAYGKEAIFDHIPGREQPSCAVGVLETRSHPTEEVVAYIVGKLPLSAEKVTLIVAPTTSIAGGIQVVARSLETALHKLHELKFDVNQVVSGYGIAPLPPVAMDEVRTIGWTNDAILYGGRVVLWVRADEEILMNIGPKVPSSASPDYGAPFAEIYAKAGHDFYKIDPLLFSPAEVTIHNLKTGRTHTFGQLAPEVLRKSFR